MLCLKENCTLFVRCFQNTNKVLNNQKMCNSCGEVKQNYLLFQGYVITIIMFIDLYNGKAKKSGKSLFT